MRLAKSGHILFIGTVIIWFYNNPPRIINSIRQDVRMVLMKIFIILLYKEFFEKHSCGKNHYLSGEIGCGPILFEGTDY